MAETTPKGWQTCALDSIARVGAGNPAPQGKENFTPDGVPFVRVQDMGQVGESKHISETRDYVTTSVSESLRTFPAGTVLLTKSGASTLLNQRAVLKRASHVVSHIATIEASDATSPDWLYYFLKTVDAGQLAHGGNMPSLPLSRIKAIQTPLPPLNEQRRIVEKIETLFARLDKGEEAVREVQTLLKRYRQSVLKAAVTGALTADWRAKCRAKMGDGRELLDQILKERSKKWSGRGRYKAPRNPDTSGKEPLPKNWAWATIEQVGYIQSGQTPKGVEAHLVQSGTVPWFKVSSMNDLGNEKAMYTSKWMFTKESAKAAKLNILPAGTIAFPKRGGAILTNKKRRLGVPGALDLNTMGFVPIALEGYLWIYFQGLDLRTVYDGSNVPQINYHDIADLFVAVPPEDEAKAICEKVELRLGQIAKLEEWCETELKRSASLRQSILKDAFAGRLVPQDPDDEPASVLLDRIKAGRSASPKKTRRKATA